MYAKLREVRQALCAPGQPFEIESVEIGGVSVRAWKNAADSLRDVWLQSAAHGDSDYLVYGDERLTYSEAHRAVSSLANWLVQQGVRPGDRVAIAMRNYPEWMLSHWAINSVGAAVVGVNAWWVTEELAWALNDCAPRAIICDAERLERFEAVRGELPPMHVVGVRCDSALPGHAVAWSEVLQTPSELPEVSIEPEDDACIFYTSGTTGRPKGARLTHRGCTNNLLTTLFNNLSQKQAQASDVAENPGDDSQMSLLITTPMFHVTANNVLAQTNTLVGSKLVFMYRWDAGEALRIIEREKVKVLSGVPVMSRELLAHPDFEITDTSSLVTLGGGGAAVQPDLVDTISTRSTANPTQGFGMTEVCGLATGASGAFLVDRPGSVGPLSPIFEGRCIDEQGRELPQGERGEIQLKSAQVIKGYLNRPEATAETIVGGWLCTGDIGYFDEDDFLYIVDRAKEIVLRGGENISCGEVEATLFRHPGVAEASVFSVPDDILGEEVGAAVYPGQGKPPSAGELRDFCGEHLAAYKIPRYIWVLDTPLPRNASGKFLKKDLQANLQTGQAS